MTVPGVLHRHPNRHHSSTQDWMMTMTNQRKVEIFSAGCPACAETVELVRSIACPSCEVTVLDMNDTSVASRATSLGIRSVPAVVVDGTLAACCAAGGPDEGSLRAAGIGQTI